MSHQISTSLLKLLWMISWQTGLLALVVWGICRFTTKIPASWKHTLWLLVVIKFFIPPFVQVPAEWLFWQKPDTAVHFVNPTSQMLTMFTRKPLPDKSHHLLQATPVKQKQTSHTPIKAGKPGQSSHPENILIYLWLCGVGMMGIFLVKQAMAQRKLLNESVPASIELEKLLAECCIRLKAYRLPGIVVSDSIRSPLLIGLLHPVVLLPRNIEESCSEMDLRAILMHELAHLMRHDLAVLWLCQLVRMLFFFHPVAWSIERAIGAERELACDQLVLSRTELSAKEYARGYVSALKLANTGTYQPASLAMAEPFEVEKRRLEMILRNPLPKASYHLIPILAIIVILGLPTISGSTITPPPPPVSPSDTNWHTVSANNIHVRYKGVHEAYAKSVLAITRTARDFYKEEQGCNISDRIDVELKLNSSQPTRLWSDGRSVIYISIKSVKDLAPPEQSHYFNIYGISDMFGCMSLIRKEKYRIPSNQFLAWKFYSASMATDRVYDKLGPDAWPIPYDYLRDGSSRLKRWITDPAFQKEDDVPITAALYEADCRYGTKTVFKAMNRALDVTESGADIMSCFVKALIDLTGDEEIIQRIFTAELIEPKVNWQVRTREIDEMTTQGQMMIPEDAGISLRYDSGKSIGQFSTAGAGHAVVFRRPGGHWSVDSVQFYGSRYGTPIAPNESFSIYLCDQDFNVIQEIKEPYSKLERGNAKWHRIDFKPVAVPEGFYVCIYFDPTETKGFYMNYSRCDVQTHSRAALPGVFVDDVEGPRDWMIRAHLTKTN